MIEQNDEFKNERMSAELAALLTNLGTKLRALFDQAKRDRQGYELQWLRDLRQFKGVYDPTVEQKFGKYQSRTFVRITRKKVTTYTSRMMELLFPANNDKNWNIEPTPEPAPEIVMTPLGKAMLAVRQQEMAAQDPNAQISEDDLEELLSEIAKAACDKMKTAIQDQLAEVQYRAECKKVIHSGNLYGTGILKAPMVQRKTRRAWVVGEDGEWRMETIERLAPYVEHVKLWNYYPDMQATEIDSAQHHFQLHQMNPAELADLERMPGFDSAIIREYRRNFANGDAEVQTYRNELDALNDGTATAAKARADGLYDVVEGWALVSGADLLEAGVEIPEDRADDVMWANVWLLGEFVIKAEVEPLEGLSHPYHVYYFDKDETSIFGEGVASIMRDDQTRLNAVNRAMMDNAAQTVGNMWDVNVTLLMPGEDPRDLYPNRVFLRNGSGMEQAVRPLVTPNQTPHFMALAQNIEQNIHELTIPSYMHGESDGGVGSTVGGLSMMIGAANVDIKDQVRSFDDGITSPVIRALYHWNMIFNPDPNVRGDFEVKAIGSSSLVAKEVRTQQLDVAAGQLQSPAFAPAVDFHRLAEKMMEVRDLGGEGIVLSRDEYERRIDLQAQLEALTVELDKARAMMKLMKSLDPNIAAAAELELQDRMSKVAGNAVNKTLREHEEAA